MNKVRQFLDDCGKLLEQNAVRKGTAAALPEELHMELTFRCNTSCVMCNLRYLNRPENELSAGQWIDLISRSQLLKGIRFIVLSGGEPWMKEGFIDLVQFLRGRYPEAGILILSNLIDRKMAFDNIEKIKASVGLKNISLGSSIDGIGEAHDRIRGREGSFELLAGTLRELRKNYPELYFSLNFTLTPENCAQIVPVYDWCRENGYHISFQVLVQKKETREFIWTDEHLDAVRGQLDTLIEKMFAQGMPGAKNHTGMLLNEGFFSLLLSIHYIERYLRERKRFFPNCPCGSKYAMLDPYGNLYFCPVHKNLTAGNAAKNGLDALWASGEAGFIREFFGNDACHCWLTCTNGYMLGGAIKAGKDKLMKEYFINK